MEGAFGRPQYVDRTRLWRNVDIAACRLSIGILVCWSWLAVEKLHAQTPSENSPAAVDDAEASFAAAQDAVARNDLLTAIASLERVLANNPGLANIKLELGLLYLRAGNPDLARSYLRQALASADAPEEARVRARQALRAASSATERVGYHGAVYMGIGYQSNPNGSPQLLSVVGPGGVPVILSSDNLSIPRGEDMNVTIGAATDLRVSLDGGRRELAATLSASRTRYDDVKQLDVDYVGGELGPRFFLGQADSSSGFIRPFVSGSHLRLGGARYFASWGGGGALAKQLSLRSLVTARIAIEQRDYSNSRLRPTAKEQSGKYWSLRTEYAHDLTQSTRIALGAIGEVADTKFRYWSYSAFGSSARLSRAIGIGLRSGSMIADIDASYRRASYRGPDPIVDPVRKRRENRFEIGTSLSAPLTPAVVISSRASQSWNRASLPNYRYDNTSLTLNVSFRF